MIREYNIREKLPQLFEEGGVRKAFEGLILGYTDNPDRELLEGVSLPDDYTKEEEGFICACSYCALAFEKRFPQPTLSFYPDNKPTYLVKSLSPRIREPEIRGYLQTLSLTCLSGVRGWENKEGKTREELLKIGHQARSAKRIRKFKSPKSFLDIALEESPSFYVWSLCLFLLLEKQTREFNSADKEGNMGIYPAIPPRLLSEYQINKKTPIVYLNISDLIRIRRKDPSYHPSSKDFKEAESYIRELERYIKIRVDSGRIDRDGEELQAELPGVIPLINSKEERIKEAVVILGEQFKMQLGFNNLTLDAIPSERLSELDKRISLYFFKRQHTDRKEETLYIDDIIHDSASDQIPYYKKQGKTKLRADLEKTLEGIQGKGPFKSWRKEEEDQIFVKY